MSNDDEEEQPEGPPRPTSASPKPTPPRVPAHRPALAFETVDNAARKLGLEVGALRARCRRAAVAVGDTTVAHLGGGVVAFKFGRSWRIRFPPAFEASPWDARATGFGGRPSTASYRANGDQNGDGRDSIAGRFVPVAREEDSE
jgi:hypothetical protein